MEIINKVTNSPLITLDLEDLYDCSPRETYDLSQNLFQGMILREKDFRDFIKVNDWSFYKGKNVNVVCSADAIIPTWAFMLVVTKIQPMANYVMVGSNNELETTLFYNKILTMDLSKYKDAKVVIKGCSKIQVPIMAYGEITRLLTPIVNSLMFGEPCSTVPLLKHNKTLKDL